MSVEFVSWRSDDSEWGLRSSRQLRRECRHIVDGLDIPDPFDVELLCARIGERRGRPVSLVPMDMPAASPSGLWLSTADGDVILYEARTSRVHQEHIIAHELGHLLLDHGTVPELDDQTSLLLMPTLDPDAVRRILGRTRYSAPEERQAETLASLILERGGRWSPRRTPELPSGQAGLVRRLERSLEHRSDL